MVDLASLVLLTSIFGVKIAILYVVVGGTIIDKMHMENYIEEFIHNSKSVDIGSYDSWE